MNNNTKKLAAAALAAAAASPMAASALPNITTILQGSNTTEATFSNTFSQFVGSDATLAFTFGGTTVTGTATIGTNTETYTYTVPNGIGVANTNAYQLVNDAKSLDIGLITLTEVNSVTASLGPVSQTGLLQIQGVSVGSGATSLGINQTVFGVESIKNTQSVIDSTSTTLF